MTEPTHGTAPPSLLPLPNDSTALAEVRDRADTVWTRGPGAAPAIGKAVRMGLRGPRGRVAIIDGCRTPFCKAGTELRDMDVVELAGSAAAELVARTGVDPAEIDSRFRHGHTGAPRPNLGREVVFAPAADEPPGTTVNLACASANRAITFGAESILNGECDVVLAGGGESLSNVPIQYSKSAARRLMEFAKAKSLPAKIAVLAKLRPRDLGPVAPAIAEYTTGMTMGEACEKMVKENDISRRAQDEIALLSHQRAAAAQADGRFKEQMVALFPPPAYDRAVLADNGVRSDTSLAALEALKPVFDRRYGTLTAGNSSPITDGGAAVLLMSEDKARSRLSAAGLHPLFASRRSTRLAAAAGAGLRRALALDRAGLRLRDIELVEMHEAFAAQILSNMKAFASRKFALEELGRSEPLGEIDFERFNVTGGSIAIGHPFGATGARVTTQLLHEMRRRHLNFGLMTVCAAGGVGFAMVVERQ
jgi:acetyl-CoA acyltransferase